jgi:phosphohistidine phosphatase
VGTKDIFYVRHAKSSWDNQNVSDLNRPLNDRGLDAAEKMSAYVSSTHFLDAPLFISSPASRAYFTAEFFAKAYKTNAEHIITRDSLYWGEAPDYINCLREIDKDVTAVFIFGHNPIIEQVVSQIKNGYKLPVPTCAVFHSQFHENNWNVDDFNQLELKNYYFPKLLFEK